MKVDELQSAPDVESVPTTQAPAPSVKAPTGFPNLQCAFQASQGSVVGELHLGSNGILIGENCQDASSLVHDPRYIFCAAYDGVSDGRYSGWGARTLALLLERAIQTVMYSEKARQPEEVLSEIQQSLLQGLKQILVSFLPTDADENCQKEFAWSHLLATINALLITDEWTMFFGCGDGVYHLNGKTMVLDSGRENAPACIVYQLFGSGGSKDANALTIRKVVKTAQLKNAFVASDGLKDLMKHIEQGTQLPGMTLPSISELTSERFTTQPRALSILLRAMNQPRVSMRAETKGVTATVHVHREDLLLPDDTTIVSLRRSGNSENDFQQTAQPQLPMEVMPEVPHQPSPKVPIKDQAGTKPSIPELFLRDRFPSRPSGRRALEILKQRVRSERDRLLIHSFFEYPYPKKLSVFERILKFLTGK